jgi:hypothetical protein
MLQNNILLLCNLMHYATFEDNETVYNIPPITLWSNKSYPY